MAKGTGKRTARKGTTRVSAVREPARAPATRVRKNMRLDQRLLDQARRVLGAADETEAVTLALRRVVNNDRVAAGIRSIAGRREIDAARIED